MNQTVHFKDIRNKIIETIKSAEKEIVIAVAWFTDEKIIESLVHCVDRGVKISIVIYDDNINDKNLFKELYYKSQDIRVSKKLMHNKFCVIDKKTVINGSYNWTYNAKTNHENIQITVNNENLTSSFLSEFQNIQKDCQKIDSFYKYSKETVHDLELGFLEYFRTQKGKSTFPYFYLIKNFVPNTIHYNSKIKNGFVLICNVEDEYNFFRYYYYLQQDYNLTQIIKITTREFIYPKYYPHIVGLNNTEKVIQAKLDYYIVEETTVSSGGKSGDVYVIDKLGNLIKEKFRYYEKLSNGFYRINYRNAPTVILDKQLHEVKYKGCFVNLISEVGILSYEFQGRYLYGMTDFNGKILVDFKFDNYKIYDNQYIQFQEYPCFRSKYSDYYGEIIADSYCYQDPPCYKSHMLNPSTLKLTISTYINNSIPNVRYFFKSDEDYKFLFFYEKFSNSNLALNRFIEIKNDFESPPFAKYRLDRKEYASHLYNVYVSGIKHYSAKEKQIQNQRACYIATLVYKDIDHPKVEFLRNFRDDKSLSNYLGRTFVDLYYKTSPKLVTILKPYNKIQKLIRFLLDKLVSILQQP